MDNENDYISNISYLFYSKNIRIKGTRRRKEKFVICGMFNLSVYRDERT